MKKIGCLLASLTLLFFSSVGAALAIPSAEFNLSESGSGNLWNYSLSITNTSTDNESIFGFAIYFQEAISFTGTALPGGWDYTTWMGSQETTSPDAFSIDPSFDILPESTLGGFEFQTTMSLANMNLTFEPWFTEPYSAVVPEPSTLLLLGAGMAGLAGWRLRRRDR